MGDEVDAATTRGAAVRRVDDRLGLAVCRVPLSARSLVTYARDHVTVRTPSRPGYVDGNTLDLLTPPDPTKVADWVERFHGTIARIGAEQVQLRWEDRLSSDSPPRPVTPEPGLVEAAGREGLELSSRTVLLLENPLDPGPSVAATPLPAPSADGQAVATDRLWHAAGVLYRYREGDDPQAWRDAGRDERGDVAWSLQVQRELAVAGRAQVWLVTRHGGPVARVTLFHDRQALAAVDDLVVHPVHRRRGIATGLTHQAVSEYLASCAGQRVGAVVVPGSPGDHALRRVGFRPHANVVRARGGIETVRRHR